MRYKIKECFEKDVPPENRRYLGFKFAVEET